MEENRQIEWIDRYLRDDLDDEEKAHFEDRCRTDPVFAEAVNLQREIRETLSDPRLLALNRELVATVDKNDTHRKEKKRVRVLALPFLLAVAAAITLLVAAAYWFFTKPEINPTPPSADQTLPAREQNKILGSDVPVLPAPTPHQLSERPIVTEEKNNKTLALACYQSPDFSNTATTRAEENMPLTLMERAGQKYALALQMKKESASSAIELFDQVVNTLAAPPDSIRLQALYLRGHAHFQRQAFHAAARDFKVVESAENMHQLDALWYRALCLLSMGGAKQRDEASALLEVIAEGVSTPQKEKAKELLAKVRSQ